MRGGQGGEHCHWCFRALGAGDICSADTQEKRIKSKKGVKVKQISGEKNERKQKSFFIATITSSIGHC